jgi:hypothetical protein
MSFEEFPDCFVWRCNGCQLTVEFAPGNFYACVAELKSRGWLFERDNESRDWSHRCGKCKLADAERIMNEVIPMPKKREA